MGQQFLQYSRLRFAFRAIPALLTAILAAPCLGATLTLHPLSDGQADKPFGASTYVLFTPSVSSYNATTFGNGEDHRALLEFSLFDLPAQAHVTSATFTYQVSGLTFNNLQFPHVAFDYYDGGTDSAITANDILRTSLGHAVSADITGTGVFTTSLPTGVFNGFTGFPGTGNQLTSFMVGLRISQDVMNFQTQIYNNAYTIQHPTTAAPTLTLTYTVPEPSAIAWLGLGVAFLARNWRGRRTGRHV